MWTQRQIFFGLPPNNFFFKLPKKIIDYPYRSRDSVSSLCGIFCLVLDKMLFFAHIEIVIVSRMRDFFKTLYLFSSIYFNAAVLCVSPQLVSQLSLLVAVTDNGSQDGSNPQLFTTELPSTPESHLGPVKQRYKLATFWYGQDPKDWP